MSGDKLPSYSPSAKCPKCGHDDIHTQYVTHGGRYGQPCEFKSYRENEHLHRYCRRCSYEWCEACLATSNVTEQETKVEDSCGSTLSRAVAAEQELRRLRRIIKRMRDLLKDARGR